MAVDRAGTGTGTRTGRRSCVRELSGGVGGPGPHLCGSRRPQPVNTGLARDSCVPPASQA